jgi:hypothetical protein
MATPQSSNAIMLQGAAFTEGHNSDVDEAILDVKVRQQVLGFLLLLARMKFGM